MSPLAVLVHDIPNDPGYGMFDHEEQLDIRLVGVELVEEGEVVRDVQQAGGLGDDQLVRIGERHLVLRRSQSSGNNRNAELLQCSALLLYCKSNLDCSTGFPSKIQFYHIWL